MLYKKTEKFLRFFMYLSAVVLIGVMCIIVADVVGRYFFDHPLNGTSELASLSMTMYAFLGLGYTLLRGKHVCMSALYDRFPPKVQRIADCVIYVIITGFSGVMIWGSWRFFLKSYRIMEKIPAIITLYAWWGKGIMVLGAVFLFFQAILMLIDAIRKVISPDGSVSGEGQK